MADGTHIEWTDATWNPITGCSVKSPGCTHCYAMRLAGTRLRDHPSREGLTVDTKAGPVWNGTVRFNEAWLTEPLKWRRPRRIFVCAHSDLFHENVPFGWIDRVFAVMAMAPHHTFQVLTKRPERMQDYASNPRRPYQIARTALDLFIDGRLPKGTAGAEQWPVQSEGDVDSPDDVRLKHWPLPNVWLGVSVEDQTRADERIPILLHTPAAIRWISAEPLIGSIDLRWIAEPDDDKDGVIDALVGCNWISVEGRGADFAPTRPGWIGTTCKREVVAMNRDKINWVVAGGESGPNARPMHPDWARSLRDQCADAGVPFLFKQWGEWMPIYDRDRDDRDWQRCDIVKRETPNGRWWNLAGGTGFHGDRVCRIDRVGKKAAGRTLDGVIHDAYPEVP